MSEKENKIDINVNETNNELEDNTIELETKNKKNINKFSLQAHQEAVLEFFIANKDKRGLLLFHGTGSGKTLTAISISERFKYFKEVIVIAPKSLHDNFRKELKTYTRNNKHSQDRYRYISSNASNMIDKIETEKDEISGLDIKTLKAMDNKFIIIDEAHNLLNGMMNGSKNATELYNILMKAKNCKILFLTASGIINNFYEVIPCLNMCKGYIYNEDGEKLTLFPEAYDDFVKYFVDEKHLTLKNTDKLRNRMLGLVSYKGELFEEKVDGFYEMLKKTLKKENYPDRLPISIELTKMSDIQYGAYILAREKEITEISQSLKGGFHLDKPTSNTIHGGELSRGLSSRSSTSYRIKSRQLSNIFIPDDISINIYEQMEIYSPKIFSIYKKIKKGLKTIVYSNFVKSGVNPMGDYLKFNGYKLYDPNNENNEKGENKTKYFGIYSGDVSPEDRTSILKEFNKINSNLSVLLISSSGAEGLSTKGVREVHIMEPYWNWERSLQVMARAIRFHSHTQLPIEEQNVKVYIYLAVYPDGIKIKDYPTDIYLFRESVKKYEINIQMTKLLASTSIECDKFNKKYNFECYKCDISDSSPLYIPDLNIDMTYESPCSKSVNLKEFKLNGSLYYKESNTDKIYRKSGSKYIELIDPDVLAYIRSNL